MVDFKKVGIRISARKTADELFTLISIPEEYSSDYAEALLEKLAELLPKPILKAKGAPKEIPIARLGSTVMDFGKHKGKKLDQVPLDYLHWLQSEQETFMWQLNNYLNHPQLEGYRRGLDE